MKADNLIMISEENFFALLEKVISYFETREGRENEEIWIDTEAAKKMLSIKSDTTLFKLRSEGKIEFSQPSRKIILYKKASIIKYLEDNSYKTF
ncbi:DNA-binding protein [Tenacibaculum agarivorans]|uniref:DNA-binding protein n=1 Tax=Tenacibaculum agarivorans TaxID=1908389 RepID=UPI00094BC450|nr:DNA-binding protein [Tenacibaculum agarivorans]